MCRHLGAFVHEPGDLDLTTVSVDTFTPHVGSRLHIDGATFTLNAARSTGVRPEPELRAPFELVFEGPAGLPQRLYRLNHPVLGGLLVFLVPLTTGRYICHFN